MITAFPGFLHGLWRTIQNFASNLLFLTEYSRPREKFNLHFLTHLEDWEHLMLLEMFSLQLMKMELEHKEAKLQPYVTVACCPAGVLWSFF